MGGNEFLDDLLAQMDDDDKKDSAKPPQKAPQPPQEQKTPAPAPQKAPAPSTGPRPAAPPLKFAPPPKPSPAPAPKPSAAPLRPSAAPKTAPAAATAPKPQVAPAAAKPSVAGPAADAPQEQDEAAQEEAAEEAPAPRRPTYERMKVPLSEASEALINYLIIASSIALIILFVQYVIYERIWLEHFDLFNLFLMLALGIIIALALLIMAIPKARATAISPRAAVLYSGIAILFAAPVLILVQNTRMMGIGIGFLGMVGMLAMLAGRSELRAKDTVLVVVFILGAILLVFSNVLGAFGLLALPFGLGAGITLGGFVMIVAGTLFMGKLMRIEGELVGYFGVWMLGIITIALVPFHEGVGLNSSRNYGPYDLNLVFGGLLCVGSGLVLAVHRRLGIARLGGQVVRANEMQESGDLSGAIETYSRVIDQGLANEVVWADMGVALRKSKRYEEAFAAFSNALDVNPQYEPALIGRGNVLVRLEQFDQALLCYEASLKMNPDNLDALIDKGVLLVLMGRDKEADEAFSIAGRMRPKYERLWLTRALIEQKRGNFSTEKRFYDRVLEVNDRSLEAWIGKANAQLLLENFEEAAKSYEKALEIDPNNADAWSNLGTLHAREENYTDAIQCFGAAIERDPSHVHALAGLGNALFRNNDAGGGIESLNRALEISPNSLEALIYMGDLLKETEKPGDAVAFYLRAHDINPKMRHSMAMLFECYTTLGKTQEAGQFASKLADLDATQQTAAPVSAPAAPLIDVKKIMAQVKAETQPAKAAAGAAPAGAAPAAGADAAQGSEEPPKKFERGFNYLIYEERTKRAYQVVAQMLREGVKVLCITPTFPAKLKKEYGLENAEIMWVSESSEKEAVNPKRLDFEIARAIGNFIRGHVDTVILIDGFELLMLQNGYENVMKFIKKANDLASVNSATIIVPLNPGALKREDMPLLSKEFDKVEDWIKN